jgi:hypothetical protein
MSVDVVEPRPQLWGVLGTDTSDYIRLYHAITHGCSTSQSVRTTARRSYYVKPVNPEFVSDGGYVGNPINDPSFGIE